ncbi:hypothetical protein CAC01_03005 [Streptomyces sp. CLI2509]|nr:hypothetical protein CAC01_03005 [Streptomyces sp. CLI2509]MYX19571.1 hypothetical protein [Streptomyces sp. SID8380]
MGALPRRHPRPRRSRPARWERPLPLRGNEGARTRAESRFRRTQKIRTEATVGPGPPLARRVSPLDRGA